MIQNITPAERVSAVQEYYFSLKLKEVAKLNAEGQDIISLAIGSPDMPPSAQTVKKLCEVAAQPNAHGYQPTMGTPELRQAMAHFYKQWYNVDLDPNTEVQPLIGSKEGILHVTLAFVNPGEKVLVPNPGYPTYTSLSKILGAQIVNYNLREDNGWQPDFEELEQMDLSNVKLMWTNYPNMPTGGNARRETYERLVAFAKKHGIVVVNDNPYSFILNEHPMSLLQVPGAKDCCIEFNSMSKSHNMPGWRVGMCASNATFISWILKIKSNIDSGTFRGLQLAAAEAYNTNTAEWHREANINTYRRRRDIAEQITAPSRKMGSIMPMTMSCTRRSSLMRAMVDLTSSMAPVSRSRFRMVNAPKTMSTILRPSLMPFQTRGSRVLTLSAKLAPVTLK